MSLAQDIIQAATGETAILTAAAIAAAAGVGAVWTGLMERGPSAHRARVLLDRRADLASQVRAAERRGMVPLTTTLAMKVAHRFKLFGSAQARAAQVKLERAGLRSRDAVGVFLAAKLSLPMVFGIVAGLMLFGFGMGGDLPGLLKLALGCLAAGLGYIAPDLYCRNRSDKRKVILRRALPDALDLMVICTEAGLNLDSAFQRVAREFHKGCPELADELDLTAVELGFLAERRDALTNLDRRTDLPGVAALTGTLIQAERYGTPLAQSLRVLAAEMRDQRLMKAEEKAARLPAILTVPMVTFILPALFIVLIGPGILKTIDGLMSL